MKKIAFFVGLISVLLHTINLSAHCQMPCGIYHDDMVFSMVDQYIETMYKGISMIKESKFTTPFERNNFIRWVNLKDKASDEMASLITTYFLQQKIKPGESDTAKRLESAHKMLFGLTAIKQNADLKMINDFADEWENFKQMYHVMNYECQIEIINRRKRERDFELKSKDKKQTTTQNNQLKPEILTQDNEHSHEGDHDHSHDDHDHSHGDHDHTH